MQLYGLVEFQTKTKQPDLNFYKNAYKSTNLCSIEKKCYQVTIRFLCFDSPLRVGSHTALRYSMEFI